MVLSSLTVDTRLDVRRMIGISQHEHDDGEWLGIAGVAEYAVELPVRLEPGLTGPVDDGRLVVESGLDLAGHDVHGEGGRVTVRRRARTGLIHEPCNGELSPAEAFGHLGQQRFNSYPGDLLPGCIATVVSNCDKEDDDDQRPAQQRLETNP
jgi:hypothetical protein